VRLEQKLAKKLDKQQSDEDKEAPEESYMAKKDIQKETSKRYREDGATYRRYEKITTKSRRRA